MTNCRRMTMQPTSLPVLASGNMQLWTGTEDQMRLVSWSSLAIGLLIFGASAQHTQPTSQTPKVVNIYNSVYCSLFTSLNSCVGSLSTTGGYAIVPPGSKLNLTSTLDIGNANGVPAVLYIQRGGQVVVNVQGSAPAIRLHKGAMLKCDRATT